MQNIPGDMVMEIFYRLPVKSLFRFTCVSKMWCSIILPDSKFVRSHFKTSLEQQTRGGCRILLRKMQTLTSLELDKPLFGDDSTIRVLSGPYHLRCQIKLLCSGNGLVCAISHEINVAHFYIWNPSTGFFKQIPDSRGSLQSTIYCGCGYLSATNDFKFLIAGIKKNSKEKNQLLEIFSWRTQVWKTIEITPGRFLQRSGILLNEALHWLNMRGDILFAFDLLEETFWTLPLPSLENDDKFFDSVTVFVEKCLLKFPNIPSVQILRPLLVMKDSTLVGKWTRRGIGDEAVGVGYGGGEVFEKNVLDNYIFAFGFASLEFEETLLRLDESDVAEEVENKRLKTQPQEVENKRLKTQH
ncbi:hypothetical protein OROMI_005534 [Orobanche minor]